MYNMFKGVKGKLPGSNNSPGNIADTLSKAKDNQERLKNEPKKNEDLYEEVFQKGMLDLQLLISENGFTQERFQSCLKNLLKAAQLKETELSPYYYLSFILNICGEKEDAIKYFELVHSVDPDFEGLDALYQEIYGIYEAEEDEDPSTDEEADEVYRFIDELKFA